MLTLGITGIAGSGKSEVLQVLAELGAKTLSADALGHALLREEDLIQQIVALLGPEVWDEQDQCLRRAVIGQKIFKSDELREEYNRVVHPRLLEKLRCWLSTTQTVSPTCTAVVEAALIAEWGIEDWFDEVWCVVCPPDLARQRWTGDKNLWDLIYRVQWSPEKKMAVAERLIENAKSTNQLRGITAEEFAQFQERFSSS